MSNPAPNYEPTVSPHGLGEDPIPPPEVLDERRRAQQHWPNMFGDPLPGRSALDRRLAQ